MVKTLCRNRNAVKDDYSSLLRVCGDEASSRSFVQTEKQRTRRHLERASHENTADQGSWKGNTHQEYKQLREAGDNVPTPGKARMRRELRKKAEERWEAAEVHGGRADG